MKLKSFPLLTGLAFAALTVAAQAVVIITPATGVLNTTRWEGDQTSQAQINTWLNANIAGFNTSSVLYKQNAGGSEEGSLADNYTTSFIPNDGDASGATITWDGGDFVGPTAYLLVKDGNQEPAWYFYNLTAIFNWDGQETLSLSGFWPNQGAISHVSLYGGSDGRVPDGGTTVALLGGSLIGLGALRRKFICA